MQAFVVKTLRTLKDTTPVEGHASNLEKRSNVDDDAVVCWLDDLSLQPTSHLHFALGNLGSKDLTTSNSQRTLAQGSLEVVQDFRPRAQP